MLSNDSDVELLRLGPDLVEGGNGVDVRPTSLDTRAPFLPPLMTKFVRSFVSYTSHQKYYEWRVCFNIEESAETRFLVLLLVTSLNCMAAGVWRCGGVGVCV